MELKEYLGGEIIADIKQSISENVKDFYNQNPSTKLALADQNYYELSVYKEGTKHLYSALDDVGADNEILESENVILKEEVDRLQNKYGETNQEFINKQKSLSVVRTSDKTHAKKALIKYIQKYEAQKKKK